MIRSVEVQRRHSVTCSTIQQNFFEYENPIQIIYIFHKNYDTVLKEQLEGHCAHGNTLLSMEVLNCIPTWFGSAESQPTTQTATALILEVKHDDMLLQPYESWLKSWVNHAKGCVMVAVVHRPPNLSAMQTQSIQNMLTPKRKSRECVWIRTLEYQQNIWDFFMVAPSKYLADNYERIFIR